MHADTVAVSIKGSFPANFFPKKVSVHVIPVLSYAGKTKELEPYALIGEAVEAEGKKIEYAKGGSFNYNQEIPYEEGMENLKLELKAAGSFKTKEKEFENAVIGDGTIVTPYLVKSDDKAILGKDAFVKVIPRSFEADIHFAIQSAQVRGGELRDQDIKDLVKFIKEGKEKGFAFKGVDIQAYASPDGELDKNEGLATDRANAAKRYVAGVFKKYGIDVEVNTVGKGEDWDGFKKATQSSTIEDKDLIIKVLQMTADLDKREQEIKNMAKTYLELADDILPQLRRAQIVIRADEQARTDEEIKKLADSAPDSLSVEELLYAATLTDDAAAKLKIYETTARVYPADWRGPNNAGFIQYAQGKAGDAKANFTKAEGLSKGNAVVSNNLAILARQSGDRVKAEELLTAAAGAGPAVNYNQGIIDIQNADYAGAASKLGADNYNGALAKLLSGGS